MAVAIRPRPGLSDHGFAIVTSVAYERRGLPRTSADASHVRGGAIVGDELQSRPTLIDGRAVETNIMIKRGLQADVVVAPCRGRRAAAVQRTSFCRSEKSGARSAGEQLLRHPSSVARPLRPVNLRPRDGTVEQDE